MDGDEFYVIENDPRVDALCSGSASVVGVCTMAEIFKVILRR
jgi:hypothetical protein